MKKKKQILLSFVGTNDAGKLKGKSDGAILSSLTNQKFDEVFLLWNKSNSKEVDYLKISRYLGKEIKKRKLAEKANIIELPIKDVTDHNGIYTTLKSFTDTLIKTDNYFYTAAISSGTPAMQVCWILLSESGDFSETNPLTLIKTKDPKFGKPENIQVKIDTSLPKIIRLKEEMENLKKDLIPEADIRISTPGLWIGKQNINLAPIELSYYRYFAERLIEGKGPERFSGFNTTNEFLKRIIEIHEEFFPFLDSNRIELEEMLRHGNGISLYTFRGNVSKINKKIGKAINNESISNAFQIAAEGQRGAKFYGIKISADKISINEG